MSLFNMLDMHRQTLGHEQTTGRMIRGSNAGGCEIFRTRPYRPWGVALTTHPHLAPRLKKE